MVDPYVNYITCKRNPSLISLRLAPPHDPDETCRKLYEDAKDAFFPEELVGITTIEGNSPYWIHMQNPDVYLTTDYFGPSVSSAHKSGLASREITKFLKISRTLGGHVAWPVKLGCGQTINTARAQHFCDRPDWVLVLLKIYYETASQDEFVDSVVSLIPNDFAGMVSNRNTNRFTNLRKAFIRSKTWLDSIGSFEAFCKQFILVGSFVDKTYNIVELAPYTPVLPIDYRAYVKATCNSIMLRNKAIAEFLK